MWFTHETTLPISSGKAAELSDKILRHKPRFVRAMGGGKGKKDVNAN
jgi:hypothetical protein